MILTPAQATIVNDRHRFRVVNCGRRFGKTTLAIWEMFGKAVAKSNRFVAYIAPTYQQARDIAWQELKKVCLPLAENINESRLELTLKTKDGGTSKIWLRGWESIETLRGQHFDMVVIDEIASMRNWEVNWQEVVRPTLTDTIGEGLFISTPKGFNHFYDLFNKQNIDTDYKSFHFTTYENPHIPPEEILKAQQEIEESKFAQEYLADFRKMQGLVYKAFNRDVHVYDDIPVHRFTDKIVGIDWGFTNPAAVLCIKKDYDSNYWVTSEWYKTNQSSDVIIEYAGSLQANAYYADPAEPDRIEMMRRAHLPVREVSKDVEAGIDSVRSLFVQNRLKIHRSCVNLIHELETYAYKEKKPDQNTPEEPIKENDHALDALRYALFMQEAQKVRQPIKQFIPDFKQSTYGQRGSIISSDPRGSMGFGR